MDAARSPNAVTLTLCGQSVSLLPQRAAYWHDQETLLVADLHLGKVETFAAHGIPLPEMMGRQLATLGNVISDVRPRRVVVLGDLLHAPAGLTEPMLETVREWRESQPCTFAVVPGNHDRHLEKVCRWWNMVELPPRHDEGPFTLVHEPRRILGRMTFAGHVHPVVRMRGSADSLRLWCFVLDLDPQGGLCTLPACCDFTSGGTVDMASPRRQVFAIAQGHVISVSRSGLSKRVTADPSF
ncbi:MAG: ligase-associated DNA damage response endonuclease PdeM [Phycisphaerales bacterium]